MKRSIALSLALCLSLTACERGKAPSEKLRDSVEQTIVEVTENAFKEDLQAGPWAPRNECKADEEAKGFLDALRQAVTKRDTQALLSLTATNVKLDFGGGTGHELLQQRLEDAEHPLWDDLERLAGLGCALDDMGNLTLPWIFAQDSKVDDAFTAMLALGEKVPMHETADPASPVVEFVAWDFVTLAGEYSEDPVLQVRSRAGREGFMARKDLRSLVDYRLMASKGDDGWKIDLLVAGD